MQILSDNTVDTSGVLLDAHTPQVGVAWTKHTLSVGSDAFDANNRFYQSVTGTTIYYISNVPAGSNQIVTYSNTAVTIGTSANYQGMTLRQDTAADTCYNCGYNGGTLAWEISKRVAGVKTILGTSASTLTVGNTYALTFSVTGSSLSLVVVGGPTITPTDSTITATGRVGVRCSISSTISAGHHLSNLTADDGARQPNDRLDRPQLTVYRM